MRLYSLQLRGWVNPVDAYLQFFATTANAFWLDREFHPDSAFSVVGSGVPTEDLQLDEGEDLELPFDWRPGLVGFFEFDGTPRFLNTDRAVVFDHVSKKMHMVGVFDEPKDFENWCNAAMLRLGLIGGELAAYRLRKSIGTQTTSAKLLHSPGDYLNMIKVAQQRIAAGDVYQICLTNQIHLESNLDPLLVFLKLREINPAPYSAFMRMGETSVVCSSPEQFLQISSNGIISTKPIKGTRPRGSDYESDLANAEELRTNEKERAENLMIVDLMRNDIGRVAKVDSVRVPKLFEVETYATVHQLVSTVVAVLAPGESAFSAVAAAFPGGSMTGAPKAKAVKIITDLEQQPRGVYSGAIGYFGFDGSADFGMTIRTVVFEGNRATIGVGGGITIDSEPQSELEETKLKARVLLAALEAPDPWS